MIYPYPFKYKAKGEFVETNHINQTINFIAILKHVKRFKLFLWLTVCVEFFGVSLINLVLKNFSYSK